MNVYERVVGRWKFQGVPRRPAVSSGMLDKFDEEHALRLPPGLRRTLLLSNGMEADEYDRTSNIRFWPLEEIALVKDCAPELKSAANEGQLVFADYSIWAFAYAVSLDLGHVTVVGGDHPIFVAESVEAFFELYLSNSPALFPSSR